MPRQPVKGLRPPQINAGGRAPHCRQAQPTTSLALPTNSGKLRKTSRAKQLGRRRPPKPGRARAADIMSIFGAVWAELPAGAAAKLQKGA